MTVPLVILAVGATFIGFLGTPQFLGLGPNRFEAWLEPVFERSIAGAPEHPVSTGETGASEGRVPTGPGAPGVAEGGEDVSLAVGAGHETGAAAGGEHPAGAVGAGAHGAAPAHAAHSTAEELALMAASLVLAALAILLSSWIYLRKPQVPARVAASMNGLYTLVRDKYRVDELYDAAVVRPLVWTSRRVLWGVVDVKVIDFAVNLVGILARIGSYAVRFVQTGYVQAYALVILVGIIIVLLVGR
jgi:NADH-quinone oxidoreductase subunit L